MRQLEVRLKPWERRRLRQLRDQAASPRVLKRTICLLLSDSGHRAAEIAQVTGLSPDAVTDIRRRWKMDRLRSITDQPRSGRPSRVTQQYRRELPQALGRSPRAFGYVFTVWSIERLRTHLLERTGIALSSDWLRRLAHAEGFVAARPKHTLRGKRDEAEYRRAKKRLEQLKKGRCSRVPPTSCGTPMPLSLSFCPTWCAAGCGAASNWP